MDEPGKSEALLTNPRVAEDFARAWGADKRTPCAVKGFYMSSSFEEGFLLYD